MEARSGGGDRYAAIWYSVPSTGVVHGKNSIELLGYGELKKCVCGLLNIASIGVHS